MSTPGDPSPSRGETRGYEAIIKAFTEALTEARSSKSSPTDALKPPSFDWNSTDQYEDFRLFQKGMDSWYMLHGIPEVEGDATRLEYLLNFLGPIGRRKHEQWTPEGATVAIREKTKKSAKEFMTYLHSSMDHPVSQRCRIYQLEEIRIKAGESPEELVERIRGLADRCNFPTDAEKERHIQFRLVRALSDTELVRKLLTLKLEATTAEMLALCRTHIAIADNMSSMGFTHKNVSAIQKAPKKPFMCGNCTKHHAPGRDHCPAKNSTCHGCQTVGHWQVKCRKSKPSTNKGAKKGKPQPRPPRRFSKKKKTDEVGVSEEDPAYMDEVTVRL